jgi:hypothetical protein
MDKPEKLTTLYTCTGIVVIMMSVYDFSIKRCSVRLYLQLFVHSGVHHIMCCVVLFVFFVWFVFGVHIKIIVLKQKKNHQKYYKTYLIYNLISPVS